MKYHCYECDKTSPCVLEIDYIGETEPNQCPFYTKDITGEQAVAKWQEVFTNKTWAG